MTKKSKGIILNWSLYIEVSFCSQRVKSCRRFQLTKDILSIYLFIYCIITFYFTLLYLGPVIHIWFTFYILVQVYFSCFTLLVSRCCSIVFRLFNNNGCIKFHRLAGASMLYIHTVRRSLGQLIILPETRKVYTKHLKNTFRESH